MALLIRVQSSGVTSGDSCQDLLNDQTNHEFLSTMVYIMNTEEKPCLLATGRAT